MMSLGTNQSTEPTGSFLKRGSSRLALCWARIRRSDWRAALTLGLPLALYVLTLAPTIYNLDSAELTTAAATGGLMRATGYPLYLAIGRLWSLLPFGDVGYRFNLLSAFSGALTVAIADRILRRLHVKGWAAFGALGLLATGQYFWALSLIAEVYTLQTALLAGLILTVLRWREQPSLSRALAVGTLIGLGLSHHASTVLVLPGLAICMALQPGGRAFKPSAWLPVSAGIALGLIPFLDLMWRYTQAPAFNYAGLYDSDGVFHAVNLTTVDGLLWLITGRSFAGQMLGYDLVGLGRETSAYGVQLFRSFLGLGLGPAGLGWVILWRRDRWLAVALTLGFALSAGFFISYRVLDKVTMFLPTYVIWSLWLGVGLQWLVDLWSESPRGARLLRAGVALLVALALGWNWRLADQSHDRSTRERAEAILDRAEPGALIFGWWDTAPAVSYLQLVEGQRPDVRVINRFLVPYDALLIWIEREAQVRPVYIDTAPPELLDTLYAEASGPLVVLRPRAIP